MSYDGRMNFQAIRRDNPPLAFRLTPQGSRANGEGGLVHFADARRLKTLCRVKGAGYRMHSTDPERVTCPDCRKLLSARQQPSCGAPAGAAGLSADLKKKPDVSSCDPLPA